MDLRWCHGFQNVALLRIFEPRLRWSNPSGTGESASHAPTLKTTRLECAWLSVKRNSDRPRGKVKSPKRSFLPGSRMEPSRRLRSLTRSLPQGEVSLLRLNGTGTELSVEGMKVGPFTVLFGITWTCCALACIGTGNTDPLDYAMGMTILIWLVWAFT